MMHHLLFSVDRVRCALPLATVRIVLQMVQPGPAMESHPGLFGTVNFHGQIIPAYSVRSFFGMPDRAPRLTDKLIIAEAGTDSVALWVDDTHVLQQSPVPAAPAEKMEIRETLAPGVNLTGDGTVLFSDLPLFLQPGHFTVLKPRQEKHNPRRGVPS